MPVPPGFTITTEVCRWYYAQRPQLCRAAFEEQQRDALDRLERVMGKRLGDPGDPLLVSVRSGAKFSMPGMMDTILNLGLNDRSVEGLAAKTGNPRFAWDCYRRFVADVRRRRAGRRRSATFERPARGAQAARRAKRDADLTADDLRGARHASSSRLVRKRTGREFPQDPLEQLALARDAVFRSWNNERASTTAGRTGSRTTSAPR